LKKLTLVFVCLFLLGAGLRAVNVLRPVDTTSWRESDEASIARNYAREGMNPFYPRIDWRGDGPGYAEMEFPLYPWLIAICYKIFGIHEVTGRIITFIFSLVAMLFFFKLARYLLSETGAVIASLFFALSPLVINISNSLQPEGLMFLAYIVAVYYFLRWLDDDSWRNYGLALAATALAILGKATAAHIGIFFAMLVLSRWGLKALKQPRIWLFGAGALVPSFLWYTHAHKLWLTYGNSLGVSNETHWAGLDLFTNSAFILGIERAEVFYVWMPTGLILVVLAALLGKSEKAIKPSLYWLISIGIYYLIAARTTSDSWAIYYHVVSIPAVALMIGAGVEAITHLKYERKLLLLLILASVSLIAVLDFAGFMHLAGFNSRLLVKLSILCGLTALLLLLLLFKRDDKAAEVIGSRHARLNTLVIYFAIVCAAATFLYQVKEVREEFQARDAEGKLFACAQKFAPAIPENVLIVASGGACSDPTGFPVAYNSSYMFYWLDRKGFNLCVEQQSVAALKLLQTRGARYFVAEKSALRMKQGFEDELRRTFPLIAECDEAYLFQLR
jgi:4-amino-4-deoxy-L-arabinose transferase-like glycosyltransferase